MVEQSSVKLPGTAEKIIERPGEVAKAQISIEGGDPLYAELRIENSLRSPTGEQVKLKKGAQVEVTVQAT